MSFFADIKPEKWRDMGTEEQMTNIGSEVIRAIKWKEKKQDKMANEANLRALELFDLTLEISRNFSKLKEVARARELWLDYFIGENQYKQTREQWEKYFLTFNWWVGVKNNRVK